LLSEKVLEDIIVKLIKLSVTRLPKDVKEALERAYYLESNPLGREQLATILKNIKLAEELERPICQDTGLITFYVKAGSHFPFLNSIENSLRRAVERATSEVPLRPNAVDPITNQNSGKNTGVRIPYIKWEISTGSSIEITVFPKGAGSENWCSLAMLTPADGLKGMEDFVLSRVVKAGGLPCPPTIIGVGIGGSSDHAMSLAKEALLRPINDKNRNPFLAKLESELLRKVNSLGIGPMGLGGDTTALAVKINYAFRHPASFPVAVAFQCWAARRATVRISPDGNIEYLT